MPDSSSTAVSADSTQFTADGGGAAPQTTLPEVVVTASPLPPATAQPSVKPPANFPYLRTASWKGVPFGVREVGLGGGRKVAKHQYPYRDIQWPEDIGRKGRSVRFQGFLIDGGGKYGGQGSIQQQADQMLRACESSGPGDLIHPLYGRLTMQLEDFESRFAEAPGVLELQFSFSESGQPIYPQVAAATQSQSTLSGFAAMAKAAQSWAIDFTESVHTALGDNAIESALQSLSSIANTVTTTATSLVNMVGILPGEFGRFVGQTVADAEKTASSVEELAGMGSASRANVLGAITALLAVATNGDYVSASLAAAAASAAAGSPQTPSTATLSAEDVVDVATGVQALVQAVQTASPDYSQQVLACLALVADFPALAQPSAEQTAAYAAITALVRRMALAAAAQSSASYVPISQQDAANVRSEIITAIDEEMLIAGDAGDDGSYFALRDLRSAVAADMAARGASLPQSVTVSFSGPLPSLVLAQRLYQDATREAQLVQEGAPVHPLFMPLTFSALAS